MSYLQPGYQTYSTVPTTTYVGAPASTTYVGGPVGTHYVGGPTYVSSVPVTTGTHLVGSLVGAPAVDTTTHLTTGNTLIGNVLGGTVQRAVA